MHNARLWAYVLLGFGRIEKEKQEARVCAVCTEKFVTVWGGGELGEYSATFQVYPFSSNEMSRAAAVPLLCDYVFCSGKVLGSYLRRASRSRSITISEGLDLPASFSLSSSASVVSSSVTGTPPSIA